MGAIWGSFVAALCSRWLRGEGVVKGRSHCDHCGHTLAVRDLVPIFSFLFLRGRCRYCSQPIGKDAIGTEVVAAIAGAIPFLLLPVPPALAFAIFGWLLLPLAILDFRHLWLPDRLVVALAIAGLLLAPLLDEATTMTDRLIGGVAGFAILEMVRQSYRAIRHREGMGAGDPKLFGAIGLWLGWQMLPMTLLVASGLGILGAIAMRGKATAALPFGSYLALAAFAVAATVAGAGAGLAL